MDRSILFLSDEARKLPGVVSFVIRLGIAVGLLDITAAFTSAFLQFGSSPLDVFRYIASGVFGRAAFSGGLLMAILGCVFHFCIATSWTYLYFLLYPKISLLSKHRFASGVLYGLIIWLVMNQIVLPLSGTPKPQFNILRAFQGVVILMAMVGIPVSIAVHKYYSRNAALSPIS